MHDKEKIQEEINRLYRQLHERDNEFEKAKGKRFIITMLVFTVVYFVILMIGAGFTDISSAIEAIFSKAIIGILGILIASIMLAWFHFWANWSIFGQLSEMGRRERETLDAIRKRIEDLNKKLDE